MRELLLHSTPFLAMMPASLDTHHAHICQIHHTHPPHTMYICQIYHIYTPHKNYIQAPGISTNHIHRTHHTITNIEHTLYIHTPYISHILYHIQMPHYVCHTTGITYTYICAVG